MSDLGTVLSTWVDREMRRIARATELAALDVAVWLASEYGERGASQVPGMTIYSRKGDPYDTWVASP